MPRMFSSYCGCATYNGWCKEDGSYETVTSSKRCKNTCWGNCSWEYWIISMFEAPRRIRWAATDANGIVVRRGEIGLDITVESNQEGQPELESPNVFNSDSRPSLASQQCDCDGADHESNSSRCRSLFRLEGTLLVCLPVGSKYKSDQHQGHN